MVLLQALLFVSYSVLFRNELAGRFGVGRFLVHVLQDHARRRLVLPNFSELTKGIVSLFGLAEVLVEVGKILKCGFDDAGIGTG